MNIALFTDTYAPQINGVVSSTVTLERELTARGHNVYVFTTSDPNAVKAERVFRMPSVAAPFSPSNRIAYFYNPAVLARIGRLSIDVVHTQSEFSLGILGKMVSEFTRAPMAHTYHTMYEDYMHYIVHGAAGASKAVARRYSRVFCNRADVVVTPVEKARQALLDYGVTRPIRVIPTGIDFRPLAGGAYTDLELEETKRGLGLEGGCPVAVSIGRVAKEKSVDTVLRAWPRVLELVPGARFVVIGDGPFMDEARGIAEALGLGESVVFAGSRPWKEIGRYYRIGDAFVSASTSETQGLTYIEAMAAGTAVCARRDDAVAGVLEDGVTGRFFDGEEDLPGILAELLTNGEERRRITRAARERVAPLSAERFGADVERLYLEMIERRRQRGHRIVLPRLK